MDEEVFVGSFVWLVLIPGGLLVFAAAVKWAWSSLF
jgi:hypothetical protein